MSDSIKFIHTADLHFGTEFSFLEPAKRQIRKTELLLCAEKVFSLCRANDIDLLLLAGDIFENNAVGNETASEFLRLIERTPNTTVVYVAGNHDPLTADSPFMKLKLPENLLILGTKDECIPLDNLGVNIYGKSFGSVYMSASENFSINPDTDKINIMVLHGDLGSDCSSNYNPLTKDFIKRSGMDYIALGHIHTFSGIQKEGSTYYAYSGCPEPHGFDELGEKGIICGKISKVKLETDFVTTQIRRHEMIDIDISDCDNNTKTAEKILSDIKKLFGDYFNKHLYKINLIGKISEDFSPNTADISRRISDLLFFVKIKDKTTPQIDLEVLARENSLKGVFVRLMCEKAKDEPYNAQKIYRSLYLGLKAFKEEVKYRED